MEYADEGDLFQKITLYKKLHILLKKMMYGKYLYK